MNVIPYLTRCHWNNSLQPFTLLNSFVFDIVFCTKLVSSTDATSVAQNRNGGCERNKDKTQKTNVISIQEGKSSFLSHFSLFSYPIEGTGTGKNCHYGGGNCKASDVCCILL